VSRRSLNDLSEKPVLLVARTGFCSELVFASRRCGWCTDLDWQVRVGGRPDCDVGRGKEPLSSGWDRGS
jgi:hypothetical protein